MYLYSVENIGVPRDFFFGDCYVSYLVSDIDYCINVTCKNGGLCLDGLDKYTCSCGAGFSGDHCETGTAESTMTLVKTIKSQWHREENVIK